MNKILNYPTRKNMRLKNYDYRRGGAYFITICNQNRVSLWGEIIDNEMVLNEAGFMVQKWIGKIENKFKNMFIDGMVIMPNHLHFVLIIDELEEKNEIPIAQVVQWFKAMTSNEYIREVKRGNYPPFNRRIWQRNYYENIIRNETSYNEIQRYMQENPQRWEEDVLYF
jgi:REP element-mobilizing transposase RayT